MRAIDEPNGKNMKMNPDSLLKGFARWSLVLLFVELALALSPTANALPPAPYHLIYGVVRDRYGTPLTSATAAIILQTSSGGRLFTQVLPGLSPGVNYQIKVPMDGGQTPDLYQSDALLTGSLFKIYVVIGTVTNTPIEMAGSVVLGIPAGQTQINLTLGTDSNGDGIPDEWELAFLSALGLNVPLSSLNANSVLTADGRTLRQQYLLGTYPFNPADPLKIKFLGFNGVYPAFSFPTITGRYYTIQRSTDAINWSPTAFTLANEALGGPSRTYYYAPGIGMVQAYVVPSTNATSVQLYRILVQ